MMAVQLKLKNPMQLFSKMIEKKLSFFAALLHFMTNYKSSKKYFCFLHSLINLSCSVHCDPFAAFWFYNAHSPLLSLAL